MPESAAPAGVRQWLLSERTVRLVSSTQEFSIFRVLKIEPTSDSAISVNHSYPCPPPRRERSLAITSSSLLVRKFNTMVGRKKPEPKRTKKGPESYRDKAKCPRKAGIKTQIQHTLNLAKEDSTMKVYRVGWNLMWKTCPKLMKRLKIPPPGSYDPHNHHGGVMPGWPFESKMTDQRVSQILFACINSKKKEKLTKAMLGKVRKCMSYLWELSGKKNKKETNWPCVGRLFESIQLTQKVKNY